MKNFKRSAVIVLGSAMLTMGVAACSSDADVASENLSKAADNFEIPRRIVFYNGVTGDYILEVTGYCSIGNNDSAGKTTITCKTGPGQFKKHTFVTSDNTAIFSEQIEAASVSKDNYRVVFKPSTIIPDLHAR